MTRILRVSMLTMAAATFLAGAPLLQGAYLESDTGKTTGAKDDRHPSPHHGTRPDNAVTRLVSRIRVGDPFHHGGLTVYPLLLDRPWSGGIRTLDEALRRDWIIISEKDNAQVSVVRVRNRSGHHVLLMSGEVISGGKQNRAIREDVLLPPRSREIEVPVYCVEQERWQDGKREAFNSPGILAQSNMRKGMAAGASQDTVWREVTAESRRLGVSSPTRDYSVVHSDDEVKKQVASYVSELRRCCKGNTVGVVAFSGNRIVGCDIFADAGLFDRLWDKICRSYALDAIAQGTSGRTRRPAMSSIRAFINGALRADYSPKSTPGSGDALRITGTVNGSALVFKGQVVHAALFQQRYIEPIDPPVIIRPPHPVPLPGPTRHQDDENIWK